MSAEVDNVSKSRILVAALDADSPDPLWISLESLLNGVDAEQDRHDRNPQTGLLRPAYSLGYIDNECRSGNERAAYGPRQISCTAAATHRSWKFQV